MIILTNGVLCLWKQNPQTMRTKNLTNEQRLKNLIEENNPYLNAILVERILLIIEQKDENPQDFTNSEVYQNLVNNVRKHL